HDDAVYSAVCLAQRNVAGLQPYLLAVTAQQLHLLIVRTPQLERLPERLVGIAAGVGGVAKLSMRPAANLAHRITQRRQGLCSCIEKQTVLAELDANHGGTQGVMFVCLDCQLRLLSAQGVVVLSGAHEHVSCSKVLP